MRVLAVSGSLRAASHNTALLRAAAALAPEGVEVELYQGLDLLPPYNEDRDTDDPPFEVARLRHAIADADAVLISTPEYNGTVPGQLKHAVDWASRPYGQDSSLWGKPVAVIGASVTDYGALWAQDHLRKALGIAGSRVLDAELPVGKAQNRFSPDGELTDPETGERLSEIVAGLVAHDHVQLEAA
ncbi:MAG TPA: NADPH-dependent FMN reductase [Solirubrobacteraceae bacterium]|nr:NADPH-dependent FMN reductase [Solirubrobacteraceae bacterium]